MQWFKMPVNFTEIDPFRSLLAERKYPEFAILMVILCSRNLLKKKQNDKWVYSINVKEMAYKLKLKPSKFLKCMDFLREKEILENKTPGFFDVPFCHLTQSSGFFGNLICHLTQFPDFQVPENFIFFKALEENKKRIDKDKKKEKVKKEKAAEETQNRDWELLAEEFER